MAVSIIRVVLVLVLAVTVLLRAWVRAMDAAAAAACIRRGC